jgi:hypothetical protein
VKFDVDNGRSLWLDLPKSARQRPLVAGRAVWERKIARFAVFSRQLRRELTTENAVAFRC